MRKQIISLVVLVVALGAAWLFWRTYQSRGMLVATREDGVQNGSTAKSVGAVNEKAAASQVQQVPSPPVGVSGAPSDSDKRYLNSVASLYARPLSFYGKVVDERGKPVEGASVRYSINNNPDPTKSGTRGELRSDPNGDFAISDRGLGIYIEVSKEGYHRMPNGENAPASQGTFANHEKRSDTTAPMPTANDRALFVLRKAGEAAPLVHVRKTSIRVPKDGTPTEIDLSTGKVVAAGAGNLRVEVWTLDQGINPNRGLPYDWECRVSVLDGGLMERTEQFAFEAPKNGYRTSFEAGMAKDAARWRDGTERDFFVRLADGRFARVSLGVITGGDHFIVFESWVNPKPGDRNLEFNPKQAHAGP